jgi:hypothetical protein
MIMPSGPDYVLLKDDEDVTNSSTFNIIGRLIGYFIPNPVSVEEDVEVSSASNIFDRLMGNPIPKPVDVPELLMSQHNNAMQFHYDNYNAVKIKMKHALRDRNAALTEIARLTDIQEGRGLNLIEAYTQIVDDVLPTLGTAVFNLAKPTLLSNLGPRLDKERMILQVKNQELTALKKELKEHKNKIFKCFNEIEKVKTTTAESKIQVPERKEEAVDQSDYTNLQMSH